MSDAPEDGADVPQIAETDIDAVIMEAGGDPREAIRNLLHDLAVLASDAQANVSRGYVRSARWPFPLRIAAKR